MWVLSIRLCRVVDKRCSFISCSPFGLAANPHVSCDFVFTCATAQRVYRWVCVCLAHWIESGQLSCCTFVANRLPSLCVSAIRRRHHIHGVHKLLAYLWGLASISIRISIWFVYGIHIVWTLFPDRVRRVGLEMHDNNVVSVFCAIVTFWNYRAPEGSVAFDTHTLSFIYQLLKFLSKIHRQTHTHTLPHIYE